MPSVVDMITEAGGDDASAAQIPDSAREEATLLSPPSPTPGPSTSSETTPATTTHESHQHEPDAQPIRSETTSTKDESDPESTYYLKWVQWNEGKIPIVMQSINGPCPLIATMNVLLLRERVKLPSMLEQITATQLLGYIGECIMDSMPTKDIKIEAMLNLEQNIHDAIEILPKLKTGLDVNIRFTGITHFEYTRECIIFDLLRIPLYHGWISDQSLIELQNAIGENSSYNQLVDFIITNKFSSNPDIQTKVLIAEEFLQRTASQLTVQGLQALRAEIRENEIGILFRNNHFLTLFKRGQDIYTLVSDHGYLTEDNIIWESLDSVDGAGRFYDSNFNLAEVTNRQVSALGAIDQTLKQLEDDYLIALSLKEEEEDALQQEQERQQQQQRQQERAPQEQLAAAHNQDEWPCLRQVPTSREIKSGQRLSGVFNRPAVPDQPIQDELEVQKDPAQPDVLRNEEQLSELPNQPDPSSSSGRPLRVARVEATITLPTSTTSDLPYASNPMASGGGHSQESAATTLPPPPQQQPTNSQRTNGRRTKSDKNSRESTCRIN